MHHPNPKDPLSPVEQLAYTGRHPITGYPLEHGSGALSDDQQAELHCRTIDAEQGRAAGNEMRRKCGLPVAEDITVAATKIEQDHAAKDKAAYAALEEKPALVARIGALEADLAAIRTAAGPPSSTAH
jgi:hypothetical protein